MLLTCVVAGVREWGRDACALGLLLVLIALVPFAYASPPDAAWIGGVYDGADFDDVVVVVVSATGLVGSPVVLARPPDSPARAVRSHETVISPTALSSPFTIRAPPSTRLIPVM